MLDVLIINLCIYSVNPKLKTAKTIVLAVLRLPRLAYWLTRND